MGAVLCIWFVMVVYDKLCAAMVVAIGLNHIYNPSIVTLHADVVCNRTLKESITVYA